MSVEALLQEVGKLQPCRVHGQVTSVMGMLVEVGGVERRVPVGGLVNVYTSGGSRVPCEVVGFRNGRALCMPYGSVTGIGLGCRAQVSDEGLVLHPSDRWRGRVVNALGQPIDGKGVLPAGGHGIPIVQQPPPAHQRRRVGGKLDVGVRAINTFLTCCQGQRMGIFAGSGVGKSSLLSMMARYTDADVNVIGLVGERGREVQEFIEEDLGREGMRRTILVVATSDESPLMRRQAAHTTLAIAEYFRDQGKQVLCLMDSVTRFAMAQREIGLSAGEPPTTKGYPPTVFAELPRLLERAGPGQGEGAITGLFTVLVEGDDHNEPIADAVRGILDGHIVLARSIAERGRYPPIDILRSISRTMPGCNTDEQNRIVRRARDLMATYEDMAELIRLGAYRKGSDAKVDEAIHYRDGLEQVLSQDRFERAGLAEGYRDLAKVLGERYNG